MSISTTAKVPLINRLRNWTARAVGPWGVFFKGFLKHPMMVGSIIPSSRFTVRKMLAPVDWQNTKLFVEYGPGVGTFCRPVLERMGPDATLLAIDLNPDFVDYLNRSIRDSRFIAVHGSAADIEEILGSLKLGRADYILSGLPFSTLPGDLGWQIARSTARALRPGGAFLVYQFVGKARDFMAPYFASVDHGYELKNVLPCHLFWAWKRGRDEQAGEAQGDRG